MKKLFVFVIKLVVTAVVTAVASAIGSFGSYCILEAVKEKEEEGVKCQPGIRTTDKKEHEDEDIVVLGFRQKVD